MDKHHQPVQLIGRHYRTGDVVRVTIRDGLIDSIVAETHDNAESLPWIAPGLVDLQVNGYAGLDLNADGLTVDVVRELCTALGRQGVTQFLPTLITGADETITAAIRVIRTAVDSDPQLAAMMPGIHLEGPFISPEDGPRGAHNREYVQAPDWDLFCRWQEAADGSIRLLTMSPEWSESSAFIRRCVATGVRVAIGHTAATTEQIDAAVAAGASMSTHLGNGAHPILRRHPNYIWDQLANDQLWASVIGDGFHLPRSVLKVFLAVKKGRCFLVSDTVSLAGLSPGTYHTPVGGDVVLTREGRLHLANHDDLLAGSALPLLGAVTKMAGMGLCTGSEAWDLASIGPSEYLGLTTRSGLMVGAPADLVVYRSDIYGSDVESTSTPIHIERAFSHGNLLFSSGTRVE